MTITDDKYEMLFQTLKWLAASIGISGIFIVTGYVVESAYQDMLGIAPSSETVSVKYILAAGGYWLDTLAVAGTWISQSNWNLFITLAVLLVIFVGVGAEFLSKTRIPLITNVVHILNRIVAILRQLILFAAICFSLTQIFTYYLPISLIGNILNKASIESELYGHSGTISKHSSKIWEEMVCSRMPGATINEVKCKQNRGVPKRSLERRFLINWVSTLVLIGGVIWLLGHKAKGYNKGRQEKSCRVPNGLLLLTVLLSVFNLLMLPYAYGKTIRSTSTKEIVIQLDLESDNIVHGYVLSEDDKAVTIFEKEHRMVWEIPRSIIKLIKVEGFADVLEHHWSLNIKGKAP